MCTIIRCMYLYVISSIHCRYVGVTIGTYDKHLTDEFDRARDSSKVCVCFFSSELTASFYLVQNTRVQRLFGASFTSNMPLYCSVFCEVNFTAPHYYILIERSTDHIMLSSERE